MLVIYTIKSAKSIDIHRGKKTSTLKVKDPLLFEILIFRNGQRRPYNFCSDDFNLGAT